jgi:hypothetical protein
MLLKVRLARMARCMAMACAAAVLESAVLLALGRPSLTITAVVLGVGVVAAAAYAAAAAVSHVSAAMWADRRLGLKDLLVTAWSIQGLEAASKPWTQAVLGMAEERCRQIPPSQLKETLGGGRLWSAIGLSAALAVCVGAFSPRPSDEGLAAGLPRVVAGHELPAQTASASEASPAVQQLRPAAEAPQDERSNRPSGEASVGIGNPAGQSVQDHGGAPTSGEQGGVAAGLSRTPVQVAAQNETALGKGMSRGGSNSPVARGGIGNSVGARPGNSGALAGAANSMTPAAPWQTDQWPADRRAALAAIQSGRVDPADQDLVRDYFQRP